MLVRIRKAQSTLEYALLITVVVGVLLTMQSYIKRGMQGNLRDTTNQIGDQYSPGITTGTYTLNSGSTTNETYTPGTAERSLNIQVLNGTQNSTLEQEIIPLHKENWPTNFKWT